MTHTYTFGNLYSFDPNLPVYAQLDKAVELFWNKHEITPDLLLIHPDNVGDMSGVIVADNFTLQVIPDKRQSRKAFELAKRGE